MAGVAEGLAAVGLIPAPPLPELGAHLTRACQVQQGAKVFQEVERIEVRLTSTLHCRME